MPKFSIVVTRTIKEIYDEIEIEADDAEDAQDMAKEMAQDEDMAITSSDENFEYITAKIDDADANDANNAA